MLVVACLSDQVGVARIQELCFVARQKIRRITPEISLEGILLAVHQFDEVALGLLIEHRLAVRWYFHI